MKKLNPNEIEIISGGSKICAMVSGAGAVIGVATMLTLPVGWLLGSVVTVVNIGCLAKWW